LPPAHLAAPPDHQAGNRQRAADGLTEIFAKFF